VTAKKHHPCIMCTNLGRVFGVVRKCGTHKALDFSTLRFGTRRSVVQNPFTQDKLGFRIEHMKCSATVRYNPVWVQDWVQLIEGRMAFPVRKRRQIGHLAF